MGGDGGEWEGENGCRRPVMAAHTAPKNIHSYMHTRHHMYIHQKIYTNVCENAHRILSVNNNLFKNM